MVSVNWFEGGRRITKLFMACAALIGAYNAYFEFSPPALEFTTASPLGPWKVNLPTTDAADGEEASSECLRSEKFWRYEITPGLVRDVNICVEAVLTDADVVDNLAKRGKFGDFDVEGALAAGYSEKEIAAYLFAALRLDDDRTRLKDVETALSRAKKAGDTNGARELIKEEVRLRAIVEQRQEKQKLLSSDLSSASPTEFSGWEDQRIEEFEIDPDTAAKIDKELPGTEREAFLEHVKEVLLITAYFIGGFWVFSFVIGWIIRGFAGIPRGQDFRPKLIATVE
jgi:hypothetical protein